ncbi:MAG: hypothetical protein SPF24_09505 [Sodaliphilus sp.]|nr:hypothetical protein [Sodaliphilus sp.]
MKYHVPTGFGFSSKARGFYPFGDRCEALASLKGCFFMFLFLCPQHLSAEPFFHVVME